MDAYTIYLANLSPNTQKFWCFLTQPEELADDPGVYANSSAFLTVDPNSPALNKFVIPVQYVVGAGASHQPVGLNVRVDSDVTNNAELGDIWNTDYANAPPTMSQAGTGGPANSISIVSNAFDKARNENMKWFANQTFGIETEAGFIGMSWSPQPQQSRVLTPDLGFFVAIGDYGYNQLADWDSFSDTAAKIEVPGSFLYAECTVTLDSDGSFIVTQGPPPPQAIA